LSLTYRHAGVLVTSKIDNQMRNLYSYSINFSFPGEEIGLGWLYLSSMCHAFLNDYPGAATRMCHLVVAIRTNTTDEQTELRKNLTFYSAVYHYLTAMANMNDHEKALSYPPGVVQPRALRQAGLPVLRQKADPDKAVSRPRCQ